MNAKLQIILPSETTFCFAVWRHLLLFCLTFYHPLFLQKNRGYFAQFSPLQNDSWKSENVPCWGTRSISHSSAIICPFHYHVLLKATISVGSSGSLLVCVCVHCAHKRLYGHKHAEQRHQIKSLWIRLSQITLAGVTEPYGAKFIQIQKMIRKQPVHQIKTCHNTVYAPANVLQVDSVVDRFHMIMHACAYT